MLHVGNTIAKQSKSKNNSTVVLQFSRLEMKRLLKFRNL